MKTPNHDDKVLPSLTPEELAALERARKMPITFDEDCPETTPETARQFHRVHPRRSDKV